LKIGPQNYKHDISPISFILCAADYLFYGVTIKSQEREDLQPFFCRFLFASHVIHPPPHVIMIVKEKRCNVDTKHGAGLSVALPHSVMKAFCLGKFGIFRLSTPPSNRHISFISNSRRDIERKPINNLVSCYSLEGFYGFYRDIFLIDYLYGSSDTRHTRFVRTKKEKI
jgi:hypothetical protein